MPLSSKIKLSLQSNQNKSPGEPPDIISDYFLDKAAKTFKTIFQTPFQTNYSKRASRDHFRRLSRPSSRITHNEPADTISNDKTKLQTPSPKINQNKPPDAPPDIILEGSTEAPKNSQIDYRDIT